MMYLRVFHWKNRVRLETFDGAGNVTAVLDVSADDAQSIGLELLIGARAARYHQDDGPDAPPLHVVLSR